MMKRAFFAIIVICCFFLFPSCAKKGESNEIIIGVFEPQTGENGGGGYQEVLGIRFAATKYPTVNINGTEYKVKLVEVDNKSDKTEAISAAQSLVSHKAKIVIGSYGSGVSIAAGPVFESAGIIAIGPSCTNPQVTLGNPNYFRTTPIDPFQGTVMANYSYNKGYRKVAIITQLGDDYSAGLGVFFENAFKNLGGTIVREVFQTNQTDFKAILTKIKSQNPDAIFAPSSIATAPLIIKQARELGITAPLMAGDTWENPTIIENAGRDAEGITFSTFFEESALSTSDNKELLTEFKDYLEKNGQSRDIAAVSALGFDAYVTAIKALEKANSLKTEDIRNAMNTLEFKGITGNISFDENGDVKRSEAFIKTVENGTFKFLTVTRL